MAAIAKSGTPSLSTPTPSFEHRLGGLYAGAAAVGAGDACSIDSNGAVVLYETGLRFRGIAAGPASPGEPVTLYQGVNFYYGSGMTPGTEVYLSETVDGGLDTAGTVAVGFVVDATRIQFYPLGTHTPTT